MIFHLLPSSCLRPGIAGGFSGVGVLGQQNHGGRPQKTLQSVSKMEDPQYLTVVEYVTKMEVLLGAFREQARGLEGTLRFGAMSRMLGEFGNSARVRHPRFTPWNPLPHHTHTLPTHPSTRLHPPRGTFCV